MRPSLRHYLVGTLLAIWSTALSGFGLRLAPETMLVVHLIAGFATIIPLTLFLARHWWARRERLDRCANVWLGHIGLACLVLLFLSGLALLPWTNVRPLQQLHSSAAVLLLLALSLHFTWRLLGRLTARGRRAFSSRRLQAPTFRRWLTLGATTALAVTLLVLIGRRWQRLAAADSGPIAVTHDSLQGQPLAGAQECTACHADVAEQWSVSAHAHAASDTYYVATAALFIQEEGVEAVRYCAACHNPVGLMQGEIDLQAVREMDTRDEEAGGEEGVAYEARALGITLPISEQAAEGVTCTLCHQAAHLGPLPENGSLHLGRAEAALPDTLFSRLVLRVSPEPHQAAFQPTVIEEAQLCGGCHNLRTPSGLAIERTYDEWLESSYPDEGTTCQDCHMPAVRGRRANSSLPGRVASHGGPPGAPSSLPHMADSTELLQEAATLGVVWRLEESQPALTATVVVTNSGAGHYLPTGSDDLRQIWLEVTLRDEQGQVVWQSGVLDDYGALAPGAVQFRKVLGDTNGRPIELHRIWMTAQILEDTRLAPMERREIPYQIDLSNAQAGGPFTLSARLLYRDVSRAFAEFALQRALPDLPVREMARVETEIVWP